MIGPIEGIALLVFLPVGIAFLVVLVWGIGLIAVIIYFASIRPKLIAAGG